MKETQADASGRLTFSRKSWWQRAQQLKEGQSFTLELSGKGRADAVVERLDGNIVEAIDDTDHAPDILNHVSTAYLVSYRGTGIVDRMVAYIDNDGDGKCDEMEIRYYQNGYLRFAWFGENFDKDGKEIFPLKNWQYTGNGFDGKFYGNVLMYMNKYNPVTNSWVPFDECPFVFLDPGHHGFSNVVLRVSAVPENMMDGDNIDYANDQKYRWAANVPGLDDIRIANLRLSFSLDREWRADRPHFTFGFTMVGNAPYQIAGMQYTNPRRRPPQTVERLPWNVAIQTALNYSASKTGFTWDELDDQDRWEGQFWTWDRELLRNTGEPLHRWNMRREYRGSPSKSRQIYYSGIDKRYHLFGATEGWLEVGHVVDGHKDMEIRTSDSNGDGYFDTWEVFVRGNPVPVHVARVLDPKAQLVPLDQAALAANYNDRILPAAIRDDEQLIAAIKHLVTCRLAAKYETKAAALPTSEGKRYALDVARELYFLKVRDALYARNAKGFYPRRQTIVHPWTPGEEDLPMRRVMWLSLKTPWHVQALAHSLYGFFNGYTMGDSDEFWKLATKIQRFVDDYDEGDFAAAGNDLREMGPHVLAVDASSAVMAVPLFAWILGGGCITLVLLVWMMKRRKKRALDLSDSIQH